MYAYHLAGDTASADAQAAKYFQLAADQGIGDGQCALGQLYAAGKGLPKDSISAYEWILLASEHGAEKCLEALKPLEPTMAPDQVAEATQRVGNWRPKLHPLFNY